MNNLQSTKFNQGELLLVEYESKSFDIIEAEQFLNSAVYLQPDSKKGKVKSVKTIKNLWEQLDEIDRLKDEVETALNTLSSFTQEARRLGANTEEFWQTMEKITDTLQMYIAKKASDKIDELEPLLEYTWNKTHQELIEKVG